MAVIACFISSNLISDGKLYTGSNQTVRMPAHLMQVYGLLQEPVNMLTLKFSKSSEDAVAW